jgi:acyl-CoA dehydrogenase
MSISFVLDEDQEAIREGAKEFAQEFIRPAVQHHDETGEYPWEVLKAAWENGFMNLHVPEEHGGGGMNCIQGLLVAEEIAWGCSGIGTAMEANGLAQKPVIIGASDALKKRYLEPMVNELGDGGRPIMCAYGVTEAGAGSDVAAMKTKAEKVGDKWILNGSKMWITNGGVADWFFVVAYTDQANGYGGMTAFIVERGWEGVSVGAKEKNLGQRASDTRSINFDNVEIPESNVVGRIGDGWKLAMQAFDYTRPAVAVAAVGVARSAMEHAMRYSLERKTMGKPIAMHQAIGFMIADMKMNIDAGRLLCWQAGTLKDSGKRNTMQSSMAKGFCADMCMKVCTDAVQIFGGYGYSQEYPVEKLMRDAKIFQIYEGTSQIQRLIIQKELMFRRR